ncbi:IclR family transcriptional regulator [Pseudoclavibacter endophyticus]|uniref:IclR family transcriptional regulator n=1 Tax=Pseudoclavibacter endophyticus TaxID=1778590 RepID=A0A6H9WU41_9MICO|nr:IclR family transcriptional regulator [Pseudoclavibacter endophyticus]KAB1649974.1 IclR family transcriptional regulator [Pseudoclavibacter endophyticus]GGA58258.1 IclR family transcriptional regulator [Pseudoclavibacter endophyticus]
MNDSGASSSKPHGDGRVQSLDRAFDLLEILARDGAQSVHGLHEASGLPAATVHRLLTTMHVRGYVSKDAARRYLLGPSLVPLAEGATQSVAGSVRVHLRRLADELGESANLAMFDGEMIVYIAQAQSTRSMRMFTEVGRRVLPHATAVGKALFARMPPAALEGVLSRLALPRYTDKTITTVEGLRESIERAARDGYAIDDGEQEVGVRCVAVAVASGGQQPGFAISLSGPTERMTDEFIERAVPQLHRVREEIEGADDGGA